MYRPSSNTDRQLPGEPGDCLPSYPAFQGAEQFILQHATLFGSCTAWFIRTLWAQATQQAYQDSLQLLDHAYRYTSQRLERACQFALFYNLDRIADLRIILAEGLDRLPLRDDSTPTGQLLLPFSTSRS